MAGRGGQEFYLFTFLIELMVRLSLQPGLSYYEIRKQEHGRCLSLANHEDSLLVFPSLIREIISMFVEFITEYLITEGSVISNINYNKL